MNVFTRIEALGFRCLRDVRQSLASFQVLVGPNASGKTTFLDVIAFLGLLVDQGPEATVAHWAANLADLVWKGEGWVPSFRFGPQRSALGNLPADETKFPVAMWLRDLLTARVEPLVLNSRAMRLASRPAEGRLRPAQHVELLGRERGAY